MVLKYGFIEAIFYLVSAASQVRHQRLRPNLLLYHVRQSVAPVAIAVVKVDSGVRVRKESETAVKVESGVLDHKERGHRVRKESEMHEGRESVHHVLMENHHRVKN